MVKDSKSTKNNSTRKLKKLRQVVEKVHPIKPTLPKRNGNIEISTKTIESKNHVWLHMVGTGVVNMNLVVEKMAELQDILDNMARVKDLEFTMVFDFRNLQDFCDRETIMQFADFMKHNKPVFESKLRLSYLLLRKLLWKWVVQVLLFVSPPTKTIEYELPEDIDEALGR